MMEVYILVLFLAQISWCQGLIPGRMKSMTNPYNTHQDTKFHNNFDLINNVRNQQYRAPDIAYEYYDDERRAHLHSNEDVDVDFLPRENYVDISEPVPRAWSDVQRFSTQPLALQNKNQEYMKKFSFMKNLEGNKINQYRDSNDENIMSGVDKMGWLYEYHGKDTPFKARPGNKKSLYLNEDYDRRDEKTMSAEDKMRWRYEYYGRDTPHKARPYENRGALRGPGRMIASQVGYEIFCQDGFCKLIPD